MARFFKDKSKVKGQPPGSLILIGEKKMDKAEIHIMHYSADKLEEKSLNSIDEALTFIGKGTCSWINIYGIHDTELIKKIGKLFSIHPLFLEDILNTDHRPKFEDGEIYNGIILKMLQYDEKLGQISSEQITMILGENFLITLQEQRGDVFNPVRERLRMSKGKIRSRGANYLTYALLDTIVDNYLIIIEKIGRNIEDIEQKIFQEIPDSSVVKEIYKYKTEISYFRKAVRPVKEFLLLINQSEITFFYEEKKTYLKDLNELIEQASEAIELYNTMLTDHLNILNSNVSNKMNQVMKTLTIFASIFIPLTFFAGIYGMNFTYIPELGYHYAYPIFWGVMISIGVSLVFYFKRKGWF